MKVLFISSGNNKDGISPIVYNQGESLKKNGVELEYFTITGKGLRYYLKNIFVLKRYLKHNKFDIIHAHYSLTAFVATLSGARPLIVSLMGSDVKEYWWSRILIRVFQPLTWSVCIVKSVDLKKTLGMKNLHIIPNGVDLDQFKPINKKVALETLDWIYDKKHILFLSKPERREKNYQLFAKSLELIKYNINFEIHFLRDVPHEKIPFHFNASDVIVMTSFWEGSPNVIKEAMACNCPIVSTDVGDVRWVFGNTDGCYITSYQPKDVAEAILKALRFGKRTTGRERIKQLELDSESVANKIITVYNKVLSC